MKTQDWRQLLADVLKRDGECRCAFHSRTAEREYETGTCPHQRAKAALQQHKPKAAKGKVKRGK